MGMTLIRRWWLPIVTTVSLACNQFTPEAVGRATALADIVETIVEALREATNNAADAFDQVTANRLEDAANRLELLLPKLRGVGDGLERNATAIVDNAANEVSGVLSTLRSDLQRIGPYATSAANSYLAEAASIVNSLPLIGIPPSLYSVFPTVFPVSTVEYKVRLAGFLPGDPGEDIHAFVNGHLIDVIRGAAHTLVLTLPPETMQPGRDATIRLRVRQRKGPFGIFWKWHEFTETVRASVEAPFACEVRTLTENPDYLVSVSSRATYAVEATTQGGANRPRENRTLLAKDLFEHTVGDSARYFDTESAFTTNLGASFTGYGGGCGAGPSGQWQIEKGGTVASVSVHAPHLKRRIQRRGLKVRYCDQGGTKGIVTLRPQYRAALKSSPLLRLQQTDTLRLGRQTGTFPHSFGVQQAWAYHVTCSFNDGPEQWTTGVATINTRNQSANVRGLTIHLAEDRLLLEPTLPLILADELQ